MTKSLTLALKLPFCSISDAPQILLKFLIDPYNLVGEHLCQI